MCDVFISHAAKNKKLAEKFSELILQLGIGVPAGKIYCTSTPGQIPNGDQFVKHILTHLNKAKVVIAILSDDYADSHFCLEEAGAAQLLRVQQKAECLIFLVPPASYSKHLDGMLFGIQAEMLNDINALTNLKPRVENILGLRPIGQPAAHLARSNAFLKVVEEADMLALLTALKLIDVKYDDVRLAPPPRPPAMLPTYKLKLRVHLRNETGRELQIGQIGWQADKSRNAPATGRGYASGFDVGGKTAVPAIIRPGTAFNFWIGLHETSDVNHLHELHESKQLGTATLPVNIAGYSGEWVRTL